MEDENNEIIVLMRDNLERSWGKSEVKKILCNKEFYQEVVERVFEVFASHHVTGDNKTRKVTMEDGKKYPRNLENLYILL